MLDFFASDAGKKTLNRIKELGITPKSEMISKKEAAALPLARKTLVLTGTLQSDAGRNREVKSKRAAGTSAAV